MLYAGMLFFSLAIASGLYAFADFTAVPADSGQMIFYVFLLLASLSFTLCLGRASTGQNDGKGTRVNDRALRLAGAGPLWKGD